jgi:phosphatidylserine/phosphatidylglycerophosphate/cardiolipin synthase-like enzyme/V8-like Glu-specific endopeptidase
MLDGNLREREERDAGLPDDSPLVARSRRVRGQSQPATLPQSFEGLETLESPFLLGATHETSAETLRGSVGQNGANRSDDVTLVQHLINAHLPIPLAPLVEDGKCGPKTIFAIKTYQQRIVGMNPPDGRVDPGGKTFRSLSGQNVIPPTPVGPTRPPIPVRPGPAPIPGGVPNVTPPSNMRPAAWAYLLPFTRQHEGAVFNMYNNRPASSTKQDVTCGIGFLLDPRSVVTQAWVKEMFFNPATHQTPTDEQMLADWDAAANLARTGNNLGQYRLVCKMQMYPDRVYNRMALILRDQKLPALLRSFPDDFRDFPNFPAAAQVFSVSFAYGRLPFDFPKMRASIREGRWADASQQCRLQGASAAKNKAHAELLLLAQQVVDQHLDPDTLPPLAGTQSHESERAPRSSDSEINENMPVEVVVAPRPLTSRPFDPYQSLRAALPPEHANLDANDLTGVLGPMPAAVVLHQFLNSPQMRQASLASVLGKASRRSVLVHGSLVPVPTYLRLVSRLCREVAELSEAEGERSPESEGEIPQSFEIPLQEQEFSLDALPPAVQAKFAKTDSSAWRGAVDEAIRSGIKNPNQLADIIFFMQHRNRVVRGVGQTVKPNDVFVPGLRAEWGLYQTIANRRLNRSAACPLFFPPNASTDYEHYLAKPTTGLITLMVNGRTNVRGTRTVQIEAFTSMQQTVESLGSGDSLFIANWQFQPDRVPLTSPPSGKLWTDLLSKKAKEGVTIRVIISDLPPVASMFQTNLTPLNQAILGLPPSARNNWKFIFSPHLLHVAASHHQKIMVAIKGRSVTAYCGGLDLAGGRIPTPDGAFVWHDVHAKLEGRIARAVEREFVLRWNRERGSSTAPKLDGWKGMEILKQAPPDPSDASPPKNKHKLQMLRTVSVGSGAADIRRDDIWQAYFRLIGCASRFIFLENQYFHVPEMADAIVKQAQAQPDLIVIVVVNSRSDDPVTPLTKFQLDNMHALRHEFFSRLRAGILPSRLGVYTTNHELYHSKLILVDDRALSIGSANANFRDFFMDTQINVLLDDPQAVREFRQRLWAHDLGVDESTVAAWPISDFISQWDAVAKANEALTNTLDMAGEGIIPFDATKDKGERHSWLDFSSEAQSEAPLAYEAESQLLSPLTSEEVFDPLNPPKNITDALTAKNWPAALSLAIQLGMRDENALTNLVFFGKHPELARAPLDPKNPKFKQLSAEWVQILYGEAWTAIQAASGNASLVVSGEEVADNDRHFWGASGKRLKQIVENAAAEAGLNPGLLGTVLMAETHSPADYLSSDKVSSYFIGTDDFLEASAAIAARVPAFKKVKWDRTQKPVVHLNDAKTNPREVKTIVFDSGPDAVLATAVYLKLREVRLREIAKDMKADFDALPIDTRLALTRMAMAAGTAGVTPLLKDALAGKDIMIRKAIPVVIYQTQRNATVRTAQAMHLSEWIFGIKLLPSPPPAPSAGTSGNARQGPGGPSQKHQAGQWSDATEFQYTPYPLLSRETEAENEDQVGQFGTGTRKQVTGTVDIPFRWICSISATRIVTTPTHTERRGLAPAGTGLLISPCHVLTAAHVLKDVDKDDRGSITAEYEAETVQVTPGRDGDSGRPFGKFDVKSYVLHPKWDPRKGDPRTDYAVITLDTCAGDQKFSNLNGQPLGFWPLEVPPAAVRAGLIGGEVLTAGYPQSKNKQVWCFSGRASTGSAQQDNAVIHSKQGPGEWVRRNALFHLFADAEKGQSGSPVWATDHGKRYVVGILVDAQSQFNTAVTINEDVVRQIQSWTGKSGLSHEAGHAMEALTEQPEFPSDPEQAHGPWTEAPYIGHSETLESLEEREDPPPRGLVLLDHMHIPKTIDPSVAGGFRIASTPSLLKPSDMNPGFINATRDEVITDRSPSGLQTCLDHTITGQFSRLLASKTATKADGRDRVRIGIVDLTGAKLSKPEFAGWGSTVAMYGASSPKMLAVYAAFQLRRDLRQMAEDQAIPTGTELAAFANTSWKNKKLSSGFPDLDFLFGIIHWTSGQPNDINFTPAALAAFRNVSDNDAASLLIHAVGFPYIASVAWQSGLRHSARGGLWLSRAYDGTDAWANNPSMKAPAFIHNITGLSVATFFTLLAQRRLVDDASSVEIATFLRSSVGGCKSCLFPSEIPLDATKCGIFKPFMHDCILARHLGTRYAAAILTEIDATWPANGLCPTGGETVVYTDLCRAMDKLILANNRSPKSACS